MSGSGASAHAIGIAFLSMAVAAHAQDGFAGEWHVVRTEPAPWVQTPDIADAAEVKQLAGKPIVFKADRIVGPGPVACRRPHYQIKQFQADELFQGALADPDDPAANPEEVAAKLGFAGRPIRSLATGCASGIDFHLVDREHAMFALNNTLYRIARASARKGHRKP